MRLSALWECVHICKQSSYKYLILVISVICEDSILCDFTWHISGSKVHNIHNYMYYTHKTSGIKSLIDTDNCMCGLEVSEQIWGKQHFIVF